MQQSTSHLPPSDPAPATVGALPEDDLVFQAGLSAILLPLCERGASNEEIESVKKRAMEFYLAQQPSQRPTQAEGGISSSSSSLASPSTSTPSSSTTPSLSSSAPSTSPASVAPPYPLSFSTLASLIASGAPIPGIREIPDRLVDGAEEVSVFSERIKADEGLVPLKPWEKKAESEAV